MTLFDLTGIRCIPGAVSAVLNDIEASVRASRDSALLGCWVSEIGMLNEIVVLRKFASAESKESDTSTGPALLPAISSADLIVDMQRESFAAFSGIAPLEEGRFGKFYEIRTYYLRDVEDALKKTIAAWQTATPGRVALSPLVIAMHALSGPTRIVHIWPFESLDQRQSIRAEAVKKNFWPPKGTLQWIERAETSVYVPAGFSRLQ